VAPAVAARPAAAPVAAPPAAAPAAAPVVAPAQRVLLRVSIGANGSVLGARALDAQGVPELLKAAYEIASKLQFAPARSNGRAAPSETSLAMSLCLVPRAGGGFGVALLRAQNGPSALEAAEPSGKIGRDNGALVLASIDLLADGSVDLKSFKVEKVELREPSPAAEKRFVDAARSSLKGAKFMLDKVNGIDVPSRISVPFHFNGGPRPGQAEALDSLTAVSRIDGIELPKIDFRAPAATP
jgi:hypothetical protein